MREWSLSHKAGLSSDWESATRLHELESSIGSACRVDYVPGLVHTARHTRESIGPEVRELNPFGRQRPKEWSVTGVKS